jgi:hypothetical protein
MQGNMWVESEVGRGSKFFFTITSQISQSNVEATLSKMQPFNKRTILFVDTLRDTTGVVQRIEELGLNAHVAHNPAEVADKDRCPHIDTIVVDDVKVVRAMCMPMMGSQSLTVSDRLKLFVSMNIYDISRLYFSRHPCRDLTVSPTINYDTRLIYHTQSNGAWTTASAHK